MKVEMISQGKHWIVFFIKTQEPKFAKDAQGIIKNKGGMVQQDYPRSSLPSSYSLAPSSPP
jgi:hypothetical protein